MLPSPIKKSHQKVRSQQQAEALAELGKELDFVVLNEAFTSKSKKRITQELNADMPHIARLPRKGGITKVMDSGVVMVSRYPIQVLGQSYYKECAKADCFAAKGVMLVEVTLPGNKKVQIAATHMQSGRSQKSQNIRTSQFEQIRKLFEAYAKPGVPQILAGDLNVNAHDEELKRNLDLIKMNPPSIEGAIKTTKSTETECFGVKNSQQNSWKDYILLNDQGSTSRIIDNSVLPIKGTVKGSFCDLSDHLPVVASMNITNDLPLCEILPESSPININFDDFFKLENLLIK